MGAITDRADRLVSRVLKLRPVVNPAAPEQKEKSKRRAGTLLDDLAKRRRQLLKRREGL